MARRAPKSNPDLNITSFCDIITVAIVALFMSLVVVIDIALKTPKLRLAPYSVAVTNAPVYIECRNNQIYPVNPAEIDQAIRRTLREIREKAGQGTGSTVAEGLTRDIGNRFYRVDNSMLAVGIKLLHPRWEVRGLDVPRATESGAFGDLLDRLDTGTHYLVYIVRDDSFEAFEQARIFSKSRGFMNGWEYIGIDEPISLDGLQDKVLADL